MSRYLMRAGAAVSRPRRPWLDPFNQPAPPPGGDGTQVATYTEDTTTRFLNPERGWMHRIHNYDSDFAVLRTDPDPDYGENYAVAWSYMGTESTYQPFLAGSSTGRNPFRLDNYAFDNLPSELLTELQGVFDDARAAGIKMKIRFAYNYSSGGNDTWVSWIETHVAQLAPVINANRDVIAMMDGGLVGRWGEWNYDYQQVGNLVLDPSLSGGAGNSQWWTEPYLTAYNRVAQALFNEIHPDVMIGWRFPRHDKGMRTFFNGSGGDQVDWETHDFEANRFDGSPISRSGWYNDCFVSDELDSTYNESNTSPSFHRNDDILAQSKMGRIAATSAETCSYSGAPGNGWSDAAFILSDADVKGPYVVGGPDMLYRGFYSAVYADWAADGYYEEISRKLGYRLSLLSIEAPESVTAGGGASIAIEMKNSGFGKVYNPRPIDLIFVGAGGPFTVRLTSDARRDLPLAGETTAMQYNFTVPSGLQDGNYDLYLRMPDPDPLGNGLDADDRYTIRLANTGGLWDGTTGRHNLGITVAATALPPQGILAGVGSQSSSTTLYPKTGPTYSGNWYVDAANGNDSNSGTSLGSAFQTLGRALSAVQDGQRIIVRGGTYSFSSAISRSTSWATGIEVFAYGAERPVLDFAGASASFGAINVTYSDREHWKGFEILNSPSRGFRFADSATGWKVEDCKVRRCALDGIYMIGSNVTNITVIDNEVTEVGASGGGGTNTPDGIVCTGFTSSHVIARNKVANCPDDGIDLWSGRNCVVVDNAIYGAGYHYIDGNQGGDGNGIKAGGPDAFDNEIRGNIAVGCKAYGITDNSTNDGNDYYSNTTAYNDGDYGLNTGTDTVGTIAVDNLVVFPYRDSSGVPGSNNSWNLGITDPLFADVPNHDYSLGVGSPAIGAGVEGDNIGASTVALELAKVFYPTVA